MAIPEQTIYPRTGDRQTVYLKAVVTRPSIQVGDYTMYNDFVNDPRDVPPYTVVGGVPARPIRRRFSEETAAALQRLHWWDWPRERIARCLPAIRSGDIGGLQAAAQS